jgi:hypothetical protein
MKRYKSSVTLQGNDFAYIAIHSALPSHELSWHIHKKTELQFVREPSTIPLTQDDTNGVSSHVVFYFKGLGNIRPLWLVKNIGNNAPLIRVKPIPDYILVSQIHSEFENNADWVRILREIQKVDMAYLFPEDRTKKMKWVLNLPHLIPSSAE